MGARVNAKTVEKHIKIQLQEMLDADAEREQNKEAVIEKCFRELHRQLAKLDEKHEKLCEVRMKRIEWHMSRLNLSESENKDSPETSPPPIDDTRLLQAFSYTVFDTVLFAITRGNAPDFTLISQSVLFDAVYTNISRGYSSYLFKEVPPSAVAAIYQGRSILEELREKEDRFLDEPDLWDVYAPQIQKWWLNTALPLIFCDRDEEWDKLSLPTHEEMQLWNDGELSQRQHFPAVADLVELAKSKAVEVSDNFNFKVLLNV